jgi:hypothetical protein
MRSIRGAALLLFIVMIVLRREVALSWDVVDPASNYLGWYAWSLGVTVLTWQWWAALVLRGREEGTRKNVLFMGVLVIIENLLYPERGWTNLVHGAALTPSQHEVLYLLDLVFDIIQGFFLAFIAMVASERQITLLLAVPVVALKVFANEVVPEGLSPFATEIITSVTIIGLYLAAMTLTLIPGTSPLRDRTRTQ